MPPQDVHSGGDYVLTVSWCPDVCPDVPTSVPMSRRLSDVPTSVPMSRRLSRCPDVCPDVPTSVPMSRHLSWCLSRCPDVCPDVYPMSRCPDVCPDVPTSIRCPDVCSDVSTSVPMSRRLFRCPDVYPMLRRLSRCPDICPDIPTSVPMSVPCPVSTPAFLFRFARILNGNRWNVRELISHYDQQMNWLHFGRNLITGKGSGYDRKFESTSNRCCHTANAEATYEINSDFFFKLRLSP